MLEHSLPTNIELELFDIREEYLNDETDKLLYELELEEDMMNLLADPRFYGPDKGNE